MHLKGTFMYLENATANYIMQDSVAVKRYNPYVLKLLLVFLKIDTTTSMFPTTFRKCFEESFSEHLWKKSFLPDLRSEKLINI